MPKLTIKKIAELAGVSKATVSRVLNGYPHIRPELREKVQKVIEETGYQPNNVARLLASDRSSIVGLVIPSGPQAVFTDPYFPVLTQGISQAINKNNLTMALFIFHSEEEGRDTFQNILAAGLLDGLIITADHKDDTFIPQLIEEEMPFVLIGSPTSTGNINYIDTDNLSGGYLATEHLIKLGHQRIATIASQQNSAGDNRLKGYCRALEDHNIPIDKNLIAYGDFSLESGYVAMKQLLPQKPTAIFIVSDSMALGAMRAIAEAGLSVPEDVALVGYDNLQPALQANPPLTTIKQPIEQTGALAVDTLMQIIEVVDRPPRQIVLPVELIVRASCGAVQLKN